MATWTHIVETTGSIGDLRVETKAAIEREQERGWTVVASEFQATTNVRGLVVLTMTIVFLDQQRA